MSIPFNNTVATVIYLALFSALRTHSGGFHARTRAGCFLVSISVYCFFSILYTLPIDQGIFLWFSLPALIYIGVNAPAEHRHNPLSESERKKNRNQTIVMVIVYTVIMFALFNEGNELSKAAALVFIIDAMSMYALKLTNMRNGYEYYNSNCR
jgi:accessory gene regulator protein AgrB